LEKKKHYFTFTERNLLLQIIDYIMVQTIPLIEGNYYHIYNRGNNREDIFIDEGNYFYFLKLWKKHLEPVVETFAYCLLKNHFHALVKVRENGQLSEKATPQSRMPKAEQAFANFFNAYAKAFNKSKDRTGKLFAERFKKKAVTTNNYLLELVYYIHANPQKHGFCYDFRDYIHSSYNSILSEKPTALKRNEVLNWFDGKENFIAFHEQKHLSLLDTDFEDD
jgi:REP element-mobilizing transposase RayT